MHARELLHFAKSAVLNGGVAEQSTRRMERMAHSAFSMLLRSSKVFKLAACSALVIG